jgi:hypothetical protein
MRTLLAGSVEVSSGSLMVYRGKQEHTFFVQCEILVLEV